MKKYQKVNNFFENKKLGLSFETYIVFLLFNKLDMLMVQQRFEPTSSKSVD